MSMSEVGDDSSGVAAQTGTATHVLVAEWHKNGKNAVKARQAMLAKLDEFPDANLDEATGMFGQYILDPRNIHAEVIVVEEKVEFTLPPAPEDPTQEEILIQGTLDQLRLDHGILRVYDLKTSKRDGYDLMCDHTFQVAGYVWGIAQKLGKRVEPGPLILPRQYMKRGVYAQNAPVGIFVEFPWNSTHLPLILRSVQSMVALLRAGKAHVNPGDYCRYCPAQGPDNCIPALHELHVRQRSLVNG